MNRGQNEEGKKLNLDKIKKKERKKERKKRRKQGRKECSNGDKTANTFLFLL